MRNQSWYRKENTEKQKSDVQNWFLDVVGSRYAERVNTSDFNCFFKKTSRPSGLDRVQIKTKSVKRRSVNGANCITNNCVEQWACHTIAPVDHYFWLLETDMVNRKYRVLWFDARSYVFFEHSLYFHHRLLRGLSGLFLGLPTPPKYWNRNYPYEISVNNTLPLNLLRDHLWFSSRFCIFFQTFHHYHLNQTFWICSFLH